MRLVFISALLTALYSTCWSQVKTPGELTQDLCHHLRYGTVDDKSISQYIEQGACLDCGCTDEYDRLKLGKFLAKKAWKGISNHNKHVSKEYVHITIPSYPLKVAYDCGKDETVLNLIRKGASPLKSINGNTNFINICVSSQYNSLEDSLFQMGYSFETVSLAGITSIDRIEKLIGYGANPNTIDLASCLRQMRCSSLEVLFDKYCEIDSVYISYDDYTRASPGVYNVDTACLRQIGFQYSQLNGKFFFVKSHPEEILKLIKDGLSPNQTASGGLSYPTPIASIFFPRDTTNIEWIKIILNHGFDIESKMRIDPTFGSRDDQYTALTYAIMINHDQLIDLLLEKGADPNNGAQYSQAPIKLAINNNDLELVKLLVQHGVPLVNSKGKLKYGHPYRYAEKKHRLDPAILAYLKFETEAAIVKFKEDKKKNKKSKK